MKKLFAALAAALLLVTIFAGCGQPPVVAEESAIAETTAATETSVPEETAAPTLEPVELIVFAAASMTESMNQIADLYRKIAPNVTVLYNFDSSGTLKTQIQEGADCDIFISAGQKQMNQLDKAADPAVNTEGLDFVLNGSRFDIVSNTVVMIVPEDSDKGITSFEDVMTDRIDLVALGNSDVPVGQYSEEIYTNLGLWEKLIKSGKVSFGTNVKEVLSQVASGSVDCGIVYSTDAATAKGIMVAATAPAGSHKAITYPAAILNCTKNQVAAEDFVAFLKTDACGKVLTNIGFALPER